jgi:hypothetical protein
LKDLLLTRDGIMPPRVFLGGHSMGNLRKQPVQPPPNECDEDRVTVAFNVRYVRAARP